MCPSPHERNGDLGQPSGAVGPVIREEATSVDWCSTKDDGAAGTKDDERSTEPEWRYRCVTSSGETPASCKHLAQRLVACLTCWANIGLDQYWAWAKNFKRDLYQNAGTFSDDKTIAILVPRPRSFVGFIVSLRQSPAGYKSADSSRINRRLGSTSHHNISFSSSNVVRRCVKAIIRSRASCRNRFREFVGRGWRHRELFCRRLDNTSSSHQDGGRGVMICGPIALICVDFEAESMKDRKLYEQYPKFTAYMAWLVTRLQLYRLVSFPKLDERLNFIVSSLSPNFTI
ncbi:hypothetical protein LXL04_026306 [Taraxacum kok-saghyz]